MTQGRLYTDFVVDGHIYHVRPQSLHQICLEHGGCSDKIPTGIEILTDVHYTFSLVTKIKFHRGDAVK